MPNLDTISALRRMEQHERLERRKQFREHLLELRESWGALSTEPAMIGFLTVQNKVSAHTEIRFVADKYPLVEIGTPGIKWRDLRTSIESMHRLVELVGLIVRNCGFAWNSLDHQLSKASQSVA